jgi:DNA-binding response OmpR family regulator
MFQRKGGMGNNMENTFGETQTVRHQLPRLNILVAESEQDIQKLYKSFLNGWTAAIVDTGDKCLELMSEPDKMFDMVVIDSHINGMNAIETISRIQKIAPGQHIVATSTNSAQFGQDLKAAKVEDNQNGVIDILQKPFSFVQLLSLVRAKVPRASRVGLTDHVLAIYESADEEYAEAVAFLKRSSQNNEAALFIVRKDYDIEALKAKMRQSGIDVNSQISNGSLLIMHNEEWYIPDKQVDKYRIIRQWNDLVGKCKSAGKTGLRAFCMMDCFFEHDFAEQVVDYEHTLPSKFEMPFVPICAYRKEDIDKLSEDQKRRLIVCHNHVWTGNR